MRTVVKKFPGKWALLGEHSVVRGKSAICFPCFDYQFSLSVTLGAAVNSVEIHPPESQATIQIVLNSDWIKNFPSFLNELQSVAVESNIPQSSGLGSSAALCVAFTEILADTGYFKGSLLEKIETARKLENLFHGESSGMDVWAVSSETPILFKRGQVPEALRFSKFPRFTLHDSGMRMATKDCVSRVQALAQSNPERLKYVDSQMEHAVHVALGGLKKFDQGDEKMGLDAVKTAMQMGYDCFQRWDLIPEALYLQIQNLLSDGALAVKPTGKGGGGFLVALWP